MTESSRFSSAHVTLKEPPQHSYTLITMTSFPKPRAPGPRSAVGDSLDIEHRNAVLRATSNVLSTSHCILTMAQLMDGLPLCDIARCSRGARIGVGHPLNNHTELCDGVMERTEAWIAGLDLSSLQLERTLLENFNNTETGSDEFNLRLVEVVAASIHQLSVILYNKQDKCHVEAEIRSVTSWQRARRPSDTWTVHLAPWPTLFLNHEYLNYDQYPDGLADAAAYWAEDRIFGGVVLFERGESDTECKSIYFHSGRRKETVRAWKLPEHHLRALLVFLTSDSIGKGEDSPCPIPISCERTNIHRVDSWDAMAARHIYRDPWERKVPLEKDVNSIRYNDFDYP
ncbi:hypothetical protein KVR01_011604 [Diaporthe batatas]|uniref:uncharacterized protein n=1 Tax=Diaporthe batatas TaxID=748121 RepID=UPI001D037F3E|nr:uncharacterized protein KVR01_011604 [Diaporthe batatas]KAG8158482.1 hypothetical protein KVR01_011604 [Diaporthe batatas]